MIAGCRRLCHICLFVTLQDTAGHAYEPAHAVMPLRWDGSRRALTGWFWLPLLLASASSCLVRVGSTSGKSQASCSHFHTASSFYGSRCRRTRNRTAFGRARALKCPLKVDAPHQKSCCPLCLSPVKRLHYGQMCKHKPKHHQDITSPPQVTPTCTIIL